jgi:hypothetical protein
MENDNVRVAKDITKMDDENIYYVALTRALKRMVIDKDE